MAIYLELTMRRYYLHLPYVSPKGDSVVVVHAGLRPGTTSLISFISSPCYVFRDRPRSSRSANDDEHEKFGYSLFSFMLSLLSSSLYF